MIQLEQVSRTPIAVEIETSGLTAKSERNKLAMKKIERHLNLVPYSGLETSSGLRTL